MSGEQHGTRARYRKGCRDECCREAERRYRAEYRRRLRLAAGQPEKGFRPWGRAPSERS